ncbi:unnamed protein product [Gadus morhua 'NCC']
MEVVIELELEVKGLMEVVIELELEVKGLMEVVIELELEVKGLMEVVIELELEVKGLMEVVIELEVEVKGLMEVVMVPEITSSTPPRHSSSPTLLPPFHLPSLHPRSTSSRYSSLAVSVVTSMSCLSFYRCHLYTVDSCGDPHAVKQK